MTIIVKPDKKGLKKAVEFLKKEKIIIYPTETAYGIGGDLTNKNIIKKIYKIKKRSKNKKMSAIVSDIKMAEIYGHISEKEKIIVKKLMPGPLTLVVSKKNKFPDEANTEFVFRIPSDKFARELTKKFEKPVIATSANISGKKPNYKIEDILKEFKDKVDLIVDAGNLKEKPVSTIAKIENKIKILRKGIISKKQINEVLINAS